jgi:hypothetical protein
LYYPIDYGDLWSVIFGAVNFEKFVCHLVIPSHSISLFFKDDVWQSQLNNLQIKYSTSVKIFELQTHVIVDVTCNFNRKVVATVDDSAIFEDDCD